VKLDQPYQHPEEEIMLVEENEPKVIKPIYFLPYDVQLQNR